MDFANAIAKHSAWKVQFRAAIIRKEKMDIDAIASDCQCELGRWLSHEGFIVYGYLDSFKHCTAVHTHFHQEAAKIARLINAGHYQQAEALMAARSDFDKTSQAIGVALIKLRTDAHIT